MCCSVWKSTVLDFLEALRSMLLCVAACCSVLHIVLQHSIGRVAALISVWQCCAVFSCVFKSNHFRSSFPQTVPASAHTHMCTHKQRRTNAKSDMTKGSEFFCALQIPHASYTDPSLLFHPFPFVSWNEFWDSSGHNCCAQIHNPCKMCWSPHGCRIMIASTNVCKANC